ncbi:MAG: glycoside hydrolase [Betaproteobacteria bacterium]|jgi:cell wall-associated NlpC family hydrolase|nr:glycoside hydrolase [Flavobacteriales bacterium]MBT4386287.1 glycoside hydrolase [Betaproteobacteria bacterium]MBT3963594.1 glycoside hydrolase [Flavobacteriales bacterium]MBT4705675.1 glycoside hydrolase [Flavobacteriales bacterium]MBT4930951.1 glycoside hydrolase [Flavobacteriales bacterium]
MLNWRISIALCLSILVLGSCSKSRKASARNSTKSKTERSIVNRYAQKMEVAPSELKNRELYSFISSWEGAPYKYGGTTSSGVDCSGFVMRLYQDVYSQSLPRTTADLSKSIHKKSPSKLHEGDLVFFDINGKKWSHVGVYLHNDFFVHASTSKGVMISSLQNPYYQKAFSRGGSP